MTSFLENIPKIFKLFPDYRPKNVPGKIRDKSNVVYFPVSLPSSLADSHIVPDGDVPHIVWAHRWEHDKNPKLFFDALSTITGLKLLFSFSSLPIERRFSVVRLGRIV